jgi:hypothetical protein
MRNLTKITNKVRDINLFECSSHRYSRFELVFLGGYRNATFILGFEDLPLHSRTSHGLANQEQFTVSINSAL